MKTGLEKFKHAIPSLISNGDIDRWGLIKREVEYLLAVEKKDTDKNYKNLTKIFDDINKKFGFIEAENKRLEEEKDKFDFQYKQREIYIKEVYNIHANEKEKLKAEIKALKNPSLADMAKAKGLTLRIGLSFVSNGLFNYRGFTTDAKAFKYLEGLK